MSVNVCAKEREISRERERERERARERERERDPSHDQHAHDALVYATDIVGCSSMRVFAQYVEQYAVDAGHAKQNAQLLISHTHHHRPLSPYITTPHTNQAHAMARESLVRKRSESQNSTIVHTYVRVSVVCAQQPCVCLCGRKRGRLLECTVPTMLSACVCVR